MSQQVVALSLTSGLDVLGILIEETDCGYVIKDPQMFILPTNQFIPWAATLKSQYDDARMFEIPHHAIAAFGEPIDFFAVAYQETFPEYFVKDSELLKRAKDKADVVELHSPVHGAVQSEGGIILKS